jgi:HSP20 family protein
MGRILARLANWFPRQPRFGCCDPAVKYCTFDATADGSIHAAPSTRHPRAKFCAHHFGTGLASVGCHQSLLTEREDAAVDQTIQRKARKIKRRNGEEFPGELARQRPRDSRAFIVRLRDGFKRLFDRFLGDRLNDSPWQIEIKDQGRTVVVRVDAPGFEAGELDVNLQGNLLILRACKQIEAKGKKRVFDEPIFQEFYHCAPMPWSVDAAKAEASFRNGVLTVIFPKTEKSKVGRVLNEGGRTRRPAQASKVARGIQRRLRNGLPNWPPRDPEEFGAASNDAIPRRRAHVEPIKPPETASKKEPNPKTGVSISSLAAWRNLMLP